MKARPIYLSYSSSLQGIVLFYLSSSLLWSQEFKELSGKVVNDSLSVSGIHILNKTKGIASITNADGEFEVVVSPGDIILFSAVQFKPKVIPIERSLFEASKLTVYLEPFVNQLDEVVVRAYNLTGDVSRDLTNPEIKDPVNFYSLNIPGYGGKREEKIVSKKTLLLNTLLLPLSGGINIEAAYKHFSGYYKNLKRRRQWEARFETTYQIIKFYGVQFLMNNYLIEEPEVYEFITGAQENYPIDDAFRKKNHEQVLTYLETHASIIGSENNSKSLNEK